MIIFEKKWLIVIVSAFVLISYVMTISAVAATPACGDGIIKTWTKIDSSQTEYLLGDFDFIIVKQATSAIVWTPSPLPSTFDKAEFQTEAGQLDPSLASVTTWYYTSDNPFQIEASGPLSGIFTVSFNPNKLTVNDADKISHLDYGTFECGESSSSSESSSESSSSNNGSPDTGVPSGTIAIGGLLVLSFLSVCFFGFKIKQVK